MDIGLVNLILAVVVLILGLLAYLRTRSQAALLVGIAFGLFAVAHLLMYLGRGDSMGSVLLLVRVLGYLAAAAGMLRLGSQR